MLLALFPYIHKYSRINFDLDISGNFVTNTLEKDNPMNLVILPQSNGLFLTLDTWCDSIIKPTISNPSVLGVVYTSLSKRKRLLSIEELRLDYSL